MSVRLSYRFSAGHPDARPGATAPLDNALFQLLAALDEAGSIGSAAQRLGLSYRHLWGKLKQHEAELGAELVRVEPGRPARLSELGSRLLWAERRTLARLLPGAEALAAKLDQALQLALQPQLEAVAVAASHDLLFATLRDQLRRDARFLLDIDYVGSSTALERLNRGECLMAGAHLPVDDPWLCRRGSGIHAAFGRQLRLGEHKMIRFATRQQGLMVTAGNPLGIASVADLARPGLRFAQRQAGSGTQLLVHELLQRHGLAADAIAGDGNAEWTHLSVAACVAAGAADCGFGLRAAADRYGLDFVPAVDETYFVVCRKAALQGEALEAVMDGLRSDAFRAAARALPGYSADDAGAVVSLRRTLPWYR